MYNQDMIRANMESVNRKLRVYDELSKILSENRIDIINCLGEIANLNKTFQNKKRGFNYKNFLNQINILKEQMNKINTSRVSPEVQNSLYENKNQQIRVIKFGESLKDISEEMDSEQNKPTRVVACPTITIKSGSASVITLVDTGAQVSAMSMNMYNELKFKNAEIKELPYRKTTLKGAFSDRGIIVRKRVQLEFEYNGDKLYGNFLVADKLSNDIIVGIDWLVKHRVTIKCEREIKIIITKYPKKLKIETIATITCEQATEKLNELIQARKELFAESIGCVTHYKHEIQTNEVSPFKKKPYPIPLIHLNKVRRHIQELENMNIIERAPTQHVSPLVVVIKRSSDCV